MMDVIYDSLECFQYNASNVECRYSSARLNPSFPKKSFEPSYRLLATSMYLASPSAENCDI